MGIVELIEGRRRAGPMVNLALAGAANALALFTMSAFANMVGARTLIIRKVMIRNNGCGNQFFHIGTGVGAAFVNAMPPIMSINNTTDEMNEGDIPELELLATITGYPAALPAGTFDVQIEVEERG